MSGKWLNYVITLDGPDGGAWVSLAASNMDSGDTPSLLLRGGDDPSCFKTIAKLIWLLEREQVRDVKTRPLELGGGVGPNAFVIS
jgi:hypothetical protein